MPEGLRPDEERHLVDQAKAKLLRKLASFDVDLTARAGFLARKYHLSKPVSIEWSSRQMQRWGSCTSEERRIRISNRLVSLPLWVLDSVIVHELAHLEEADHGARFQELVARYPLTERARGYLMAVSEGQSSVVPD